MRTLLTAAASLALAVGLLLGAGMAVPNAALACSCIGPQPLEDYVGDENVVLAGEVLGEDAGGIHLGVQQWFAGEEPAPVVRIGGDFGNGASCGIGFVPAQGSSWVGVLWRPSGDDPLAELEANENLQVSICQPFVDLDTPEGQELFDEAVATFGDGAALPGESAAPPPTAVPAAPVQPTPTAETAPSGPTPETAAMVAVGGVLGAGVLVLVLVAFVSRRRPAG
jgi:hypothetical protein